MAKTQRALLLAIDCSNTGIKFGLFSLPILDCLTPLQLILRLRNFLQRWRFTVKISGLRSF